MWSLKLRTLNKWTGESAVAVKEVVPTKTVHCYPNEKSVLCYHVEAKDYAHEGLVEEKVDVEKTQKIEQKVERFFDDVPSPVEL